MLEDLRGSQERSIPGWEEVISEGRRLEAWQDEAEKRMHPAPAKYLQTGRQVQVKQVMSALAPPPVEALDPRPVIRAVSVAMAFGYLSGVHALSEGREKGHRFILPFSLLTTPYEKECRRDPTTVGLLKATLYGGLLAALGTDSPQQAYDLLGERRMLSLTQALLKAFGTGYYAALLSAGWGD